MWGVSIFQEGFISCFQGHRRGQSFFLHQLLHKQLEFKIIKMGTSLAVQGLGFSAFTAEGAGSVPGCGTKIPHAAWPKAKTKSKCKIINMPLWHIWGQPALSSNMSNVTTKSGVSTQSHDFHIASTWSWYLGRALWWWVSTTKDGALHLETRQLMLMASYSSIPGNAKKHTSLSLP